MKTLLIALLSVSSLCLAQSQSPKTGTVLPPAPCTVGDTFNLVKADTSKVSYQCSFGRWVAISNPSQIPPVYKWPFANWADNGTAITSPDNRNVVLTGPLTGTSGNFSGPVAIGNTIPVTLIDHTLRFNNLGAGFGTYGVSWQHQGVDTWTGPSMDYQSDELVLAYNFGTSGDMIRLSQNGRIQMGPAVGSPSALTSAISLVGLTGNDILHFRRAVDGVQVGGVMDSGRYFVNRDTFTNNTWHPLYTGTVAFQSIELGGFVNSNGTNVDQYLMLNGSLSGTYSAPTNIGLYQANYIKSGGSSVLTFGAAAAANNSPLQPFLDLSSSLFRYHFPNALNFQFGNENYRYWGFAVNNTDGGFILQDATASVGYMQITPNTNGDVKFLGRVGMQVATPANSSATCTAGTMWTDATYIYVCTAANTVKRATLSTF